MFKRLMLAALIAMTVTTAHAQAGVRFSIGIGIPLFAPPPRPVYVAPPPPVYIVAPPAPVYVQPAPRPVYVQPSPTPVYYQPVPIPVQR